MAQRVPEDPLLGAIVQGLEEGQRLSGGVGEGSLDITKCLLLLGPLMMTMACDFVIPVFVRGMRKGHLVSNSWLGEVGVGCARYMI